MTIPATTINAMAYNKRALTCLQLADQDDSEISALIGIGYALLAISNHLESAEHLNQLASSLTDLNKRSDELRRYL